MNLVLLENETSKMNRKGDKYRSTEKNEANGNNAHEDQSKMEKRNTCNSEYKNTKYLPEWYKVKSSESQQEGE